MLSRHIKPAGRALGIGCGGLVQHGFSKRESIVKDAQGILRHSRASTTQDIYQQVVPESQRRAVGRLTAFVQQLGAVQ